MDNKYYTSPLKLCFITVNMTGEDSAKHFLVRSIYAPGFKIAELEGIFSLISSYTNTKDIRYLRLLVGEFT